MAEIEVRVRPWTGDHATEEGEEVSILYCDVVFIDGIELAEVLGNAPARVILGSGDFVEVEVEGAPLELRSLYADPASHLAGTDESRLRLSVTKLTVVGA